MRAVTLLAAAALLPAGAGTAHVTVRACVAGEYAFAANAWHRGRDVVAAVGVVPTADTETCALRGTIRATFRAHGAVATRARQVRLVLRPSSRPILTSVWRNWCGRRHSGAFAATLGGARIRIPVAPPACRAARAPTRVTPLVADVRPLPRLGSRIPAHVLPPETPIPLPPTIIRVTNAWLVSDGLTLVAVYAGAAGSDPSRGLFCVVRQNLVFGAQTEPCVPIGSTGAATITTAPAGAAVEASAQRADLQFSTASGTTGTLHLRDNTATLG